MTAMSCSESRTLLERAQLGGERGAGDATVSLEHQEALRLEDHLAGCARCSQAAELLRGAEHALAAQLEASLPHRAPDAMAEVAVRIARFRPLLTAGSIVAGVTVVVLLALLVWFVVVPEVRRGVAPPPAVETRTFSLTCLSPDQAASLLRPYLPRPQNPRWQAEMFDVFPVQYGIRAVAVRAPPAMLERVPGILARFEGDPGAACRVPDGNRPSRQDVR